MKVFEYRNAIGELVCDTYFIEWNFTVHSFTTVYELSCRYRSTSEKNQTPNVINAFTL